MPASMNHNSNAPPRPSSTMVNGKVPLRAAVADMSSLFRRCIDETPRKRKQRTEAITPLAHDSNVCGPNKAATEPSMESSPYVTKCTMPLICVEVADLFNMDAPDEEIIDSFMERVLKNEDEQIDHSCSCRNANAEEAPPPSLQNPSTDPRAATSSSTCGICSEDINAAVESQEAKLVATMKKSAASRAALKRFCSQSTREADYARSAMTGSNAPFSAATKVLYRNTSCSSKSNEMNTGISKRQKVAPCTQNETTYDSIIAAACLIMGGSK